MTYHGYKFEALSMLPKPWSECTREEIEGRDDQTVDNMCEYCVVARSGVGKIKTVLGAEVDGLWDFDPSGTVDMFSKDKHDTEEASEEIFEPCMIPRFLKAKCCRTMSSSKPPCASRMLARQVAFTV